VSQSETPILIRPIRPEECEALGELLVAAYRTAPMDDAHQRVYDEQLRDVASRAESSCVLVAVTPAGELLGGVTYVCGPEDAMAQYLHDGEAEIRMLAVNPACHGRGVGRALTLACLQRARAAGRRRMVLHTGNWMPAAKHLYEALGFERQRAIDFSPAPGIDLLGYALELAEKTS
jgi:ribosomal protein S18 acetylase RimI-like enzyme